MERSPALGRPKRPRRPVGPILADALYPLSEFDRVCGISIQKRRQARKLGLPLPTIPVGQRQYVLGRDGIEWLLALSKIGGGK